MTLFEAMADPEAAGLGTAAIKAVRGFHTMMQSLQSAAQELEVDELVEAVLARSGTIEALEAERTIEARGRIENLEELVGVAREFRAEREEPTLSAFLQEISLVSDQDGLAGEESLVTLMTIHNAKGLEFRAVFLIGMEEGIFPHSRSIEDNEIEEERRLAYVGMTRAMEKLTLTHAMARSLYGRREYNLAVALPRRAAGRGRARAAAAVVVVGLRLGAADGGLAGPTRERERDPVAADGRLGAPRLARRGGRDADRAGRARHGPLREGPERAEADARVRAAREDRLMAIRDPTHPRPGRVATRARRDRPLLRRCVGAEEDSERFAPPAPARADARRLRRRADRRRRGRLPVRADASPAARSPCAGVTVVGVLPTHRRRGILDRMMRAQLADVRERGEPLAALWASEETIYGRFGYGLASQDVMIEATRVHAALRPRSAAAATGTTRLVDHDEALAVFPRIYDRVRRRTPGFVSRSHDWWELRKLDDRPERRRGSRRAQPRAARARRPARRATRSTASSSSSTEATNTSQVQRARGDRRLAGGDARALALPPRDRLGGRDPAASSCPPTIRSSCSCSARTASTGRSSTASGCGSSTSARRSRRASLATRRPRHVRRLPPTRCFAGQRRHLDGRGRRRRAAHAAAPTSGSTCRRSRSAYLGGFTFAELARAGRCRGGRARRHRPGRRALPRRREALVPEILSAAPCEDRDRNGEDRGSIQPSRPHPRARRDWTRDAYPQTSSATSTMRRSFAHCSSAVERPFQRGGEPALDEAELVERPVAPLRSAAVARPSSRARHSLS